MTSRRSAFAAALLLMFPVWSSAQLTYRLKGTVRDSDGKPVAGARVRAEALVGFRGEPFAGQKEFETSTGAKGEWVILGLTSGIWAFEATGPDVVPQVILLPINFTQRKQVSAIGGSFSWDLPLQVRRTAHAGLTSAAAAATAHETDKALAAIGAVAGESDAEVLCADGELALLVRQSGLARAIFDRVLKADPKHPCATVGMASTALMLGDYNEASKRLYAALDLAPRDQRPALGAAVKDLQGITGTK